MWKTDTFSLQVTHHSMKYLALLYLVSVAFRPDTNLLKTTKITFNISFVKKKKKCYTIFDYGMTKNISQTAPLKSI